MTPSLPRQRRTLCLLTPTPTGSRRTPWAMQHRYANRPFVAMSTGGTWMPTREGPEGIPRGEVNPWNS